MLISTWRIEENPQWVEWLPDRTRLAMGATQGRVQVRTTQGHELWKIGGDGGLYPASTVAWSPSSSQIAIVSDSLWVVQENNGVESHLFGRLLA